MLERLYIQNFQAHDKLRIDFDPEITTIIGPSDVGKSAIIRALRWVCTNQPGGDAFITHGASGTTVKLFVDGHCITRRRGRDEVNEYHLDENKFVAFGRTVPDAIESLLNMGQTCWQQQHDAPYWFSDTAGEVSRQLNAIVNLGVIDDTLAGVLKAVHRARTKLEVAESNLTEAKKAHDELGWVVDFEEAVSALEARESKYQTALMKVEKVSKLHDEAEYHHAVQRNATQAVSVGETVVKTGTRAVDLQQKIASLSRLIQTARDADEAAKLNVPDTSCLESARNRYVKTITELSKLKEIIEAYRQKEDRLCQAEIELKEAEKAVPKKCPTCGQSL